MQNKLEIKQTSLIRVSDTRWNCRIRNCRAVKINYPAIIHALTEDVEDCMNRDVSQAIGTIILLIYYILVDTFYLTFRNFIYNKINTICCISIHFRRSFANNKHTKS